jgi:two-component system, sensor histidine kinase SagS
VTNGQAAFAPGDQAPFHEASQEERLKRAEHIVSAIRKGIAVLDLTGRITWANDCFLTWCGSEVIGKLFVEAFEPYEDLAPSRLQFPPAQNHDSVRIHHNNQRYLNIDISPILEGDRIDEYVALCGDVTPEAERQRKLNALHQAGQLLTALEDDETFTLMAPENRAELLKQNLRTLIHDILEYNVIEIRLLKRDTLRLEPLLEEGMTTEAAQRELYASIEGNGVTGYVAATGKSYLCRDTTNDPHYIEGSVGASSSMTVPLIFLEEVIGTFNVESPRANAFGAEDLQFAELFSRELALALHTLQLLSIQELCTAGQAIERVQRAIALPADELLSLSSRLLGKHGADAELADPLRRILEDARFIKASIHRVGEDLAHPNSELNGAPRPLRGLRVLVVDQDEHIRRQAHSLLERQGCIVETAATGEEGISLAETGKFDAAITAIKHPDLGGTAVYRRLKELMPKGRIILTQGFEYDGGHTVVNARSEGYWLPVVYKQPFQESQLLNALTCPVPEHKTS